MKNKKAAYFFLLLVIIIWGIVFYRIFSFVKKEEKTSPSSRPVLVNKAEQIPDTFQLVANYRDPFLGDFKSREGPVVKKASPKPTVTLPWPTIIYSGMIKNKKSSKSTAIIKLNGQEKLLKQDEVISGIKLLRIYKDSIEVEFGKERRFFRK